MSSKYSGVVGDWLENNKTFVTDKFPTLPAPFHMADQREALTASGKTSLVLTCLDPRSVPEAFFGPDFRGAVIRNAGGRATDDAVRSLTVLKALAGVKTVAVVHHTDCGVTHLDPNEIIDAVAKDGSEAEAEAGKIDYKLFSAVQLEDSVREDVRILKSAPTLAGVNVYGFTLDTFTGKVEPVEA